MGLGAQAEKIATLLNERKDYTLMEIFGDHFFLQTNAGESYIVKLSHWTNSKEFTNETV